jgi:protein-S-isoprenylcysteine O-methyltransferase Ste14
LNAFLSTFGAITIFAMVRLGGWLFKHRTWLPLPLALVILLTPSQQTMSQSWVVVGMLMVTAGELLRLWGVHHIGVISRTRGERLGPLIADGPFAYVRNPLYLGNIALWTGFVCSARLIWVAPFLCLLLAFEYNAIVRWEEALLRQRLGAEYVEYARRVPRWVPALHGRRDSPTIPIDAGERPAFSWRETLFSERGTLVAIAVATALLWIKARF